MYLFYFFAAIVIWLGLLSLRGGFRFAKYVRAELARPLADYAPFASIIVPCRGLDQGLGENLATLFTQDYPAFELIFVADSGDDPALGVIESLSTSPDGARQIPTRIVIAGDATDSGQKVHNLRMAVGETDPRSEVLVFVDTDARPHPDWLRSLVAPLHDRRIGAATGYRWFIPVSGGPASHLLSAWNASIASALGANEQQNFCWGGSTAIRRETFARLNIRECWRGSVSDDFTMTRVLKEAGLPIHFVPACLTASLEDCTLLVLLEFTTRQLKITRVYASHLWKPLLIGSALFCLVFFGGIALTVTRAALGLSFLLPLVLLLVIFMLGAAKAYTRLQAVSMPLANYRRELRMDLLPHLFLWPVASALYLFNAVAAAFSRRINWRGIVYELKSPTEAVIISREQNDKL